MLDCFLVSFHFQCDIHPICPVETKTAPKLKECHFRIRDRLREIRGRSSAVFPTVMGTKIGSMVETVHVCTTLGGRASAAKKYGATINGAILLGSSGAARHGSFEQFYGKD